MALPTYLLGIDIGTIACKTVLFDDSGRIVVKASTEYSIQYPQPDWAEQDAEVWWHAVRANLNSILRRVPARTIVGIGVDSQREAVVPVDRRGRRLGKSLIWMDRRTIPQTRIMAKRLSRSEVIQTTGLPIDYFYSAPKILWLKEERPSIFRKTSCFLFPKDYVIFRLTGGKSTDYSMASRTMLFDIQRENGLTRFATSLVLM